MAVVSDVLIKDYQGTPAGQTIQVLDQKHKEMVAMGYFDVPDPEVEAAKKKPGKKKRTARDAEPELNNE